VEADHNLRCVSQDQGRSIEWLKLTIYGWTLLVATKVLWRARSRVQSWWALGSSQLWRHAVALGWLLGRRCQSRTTLGSTASHDAAKQIAGSMADLRRLRLRGAVVLRVLAGAASFEFALQLGDSLLVSTVDVSIQSAAREKLAVVFQERRVETLLTLLSSGCVVAQANRPCRGSTRSPECDG
jgi:hypothetical protein